MPAKGSNRKPRGRHPLQRADLRLAEPGPLPPWVPNFGRLLQPVSPRGKAWLEAHVDGGTWVDGALVIDPGISAPGSLLTQARDSGLAVTGWGPVCGAMLWTLREQTALTVAQIARRLGFTEQEWRLMEGDECMVPDPDAFWDRAMELVDKVKGCE